MVTVTSMGTVVFLLVKPQEGATEGGSTHLEKAASWRLLLKIGISTGSGWQQGGTQLGQISNQGARLQRERRFTPLERRQLEAKCVVGLSRH